MSDVSRAQVLEKLKEVYDPEIPVNVVDLGLIYNIDVSDNNIQPRTIVKDVRDITERIKKNSSDQNSKKYDNKMPRKELMKIIKNLEKEMNQLAKNLEFEKATLIRDEIKNVRQILKK